MAKNKVTARVLEKSIDHLKRMISGERVGKEAVATDAQRNYLETWVLPRLEMLLQHQRGEISARDIVYNMGDR